MFARHVSSCARAIGLTIVGSLLVLSVAPAASAETVPVAPVLQSEAILASNDPVWHTSLSLPVTCDVVPEAGDVTAPPVPNADHCTATVKLFATKVDPSAGWAQRGTRQLVSTHTVQVPLGSNRRITVPTPVARLYAPFLRGGPRHGAKIELRQVLDGLDVPLGQLAYIAPTLRFFPACGIPEGLAYQSAKPIQHEVTVNGRKRWVTSPHRQFFTATFFRTTSRTTLRLHGLTYTYPAGSVGRIVCGGVRAVRRPYAHAWIDRGALRIHGMPTSRVHQLGTGVATSEGWLGTTRFERVDYTVTRVPASRISTLHVRVGRSGGITASLTRNPSPCTAGSRLRIDRNGRIRRV